jgi:phage shock protein A
MQARAGAIDELLASGALDDASGTSKDNITLELERMSSGSDVENELAAMKAQLSGGSAPKELSGENQAGQPAAQPSAQPAQQPAAEPARPQDGDVR